MENIININEINNLLTINISEEEVNIILKKAKQLKGLTLKESSGLLSIKNPKLLKELYDAAFFVKKSIYGKRIVMFVPLYISNICANKCLYCGFALNNNFITKKKLTVYEIKNQVKLLLKRGHKRILMVASEMISSDENINYYIEAIKTIYSTEYNNNKIKRVNVNVAPMARKDFKKLKDANIGTYQVFQETYHKQTYEKLHIYGPKSDYNNRLNAIDNSFVAGIDDFGIGVLLGLYKYNFEIIAMLMHIKYLEKKYNVGPHTISIPRVKPAFGSIYASNPEYPVTDEELKKIVAILRLSVPYTGIILSTRETSNLRDILIKLGVSQISVESKVMPGGYNDEDTMNSDKLEGQFNLNDQRSLNEMVKSLLLNGFIPSFCTACYRTKRTGKFFMDLVKRGEMKRMCNINALITLKEFLDDFADDIDVKQLGYKIIEVEKKMLNDVDFNLISEIFCKISNKIRDKYI
ncbi:MAG: [FeFe] hydrogenase H-cluster radical SAM maturase HydG [Endomicrobium sp.]|jgi:2-iminoacetate synthase|nr:[FeFe] hydrogenase H-cluster radical SAM maturase HydG [Endomicrobium sp.]